MWCQKTETAYTKVKLTPLYLNLPTWEMNNQTHILAATPTVKGPLYQLNRRLDGPPSWSWCSGKEKKISYVISRWSRWELHSSGLWHSEYCYFLTHVLGQYVSPIFRCQESKKMGPVGCFETLVSNYHHSLHYSLEEHSSQKNLLLVPVIGPQIIQPVTMWLYWLPCPSSVNTYMMKI